MKIAVFGGAFNPPHIEHINMIKFLLASGFDKVVIVPSNNPPHKKPITSFNHRVNILKLAISDITNVTICELEGESKNVHYSVDTIPLLEKLYGKFSFVIGGDSLIDFHKWKSPEQIVKMCELAVFYRGGNKKKFEDAYRMWTERGAKIKVLEYQPSNISSTRIRYAIECGNFECIGDSVAEYIRVNKIFNSFHKIVDHLKNTIEHKTFEHIVRVVDYALYLNEVCRLKLDTDDVFLSALLHDCAKRVPLEKKFAKYVPKDAIGTAVEHQFLGAVIAEKIYKVNNIQVLDAIKYHTTGRAEMSCLEKLIYSADMLELGRNYEEVDAIRKAIKNNFDEGFKACIFHQYRYLLNSANKNDIYPLTKSCADYYKEN